MIEPPLLTAILDVADEVHPDSARALAAFLAGCSGPSEASGRLMSLPTTQQRDLIEPVVRRWNDSPAVSGIELAAALMAARTAVDRAAARQQIELIWTGPRPPESVFRRTDQALFDVIDRARDRLLLITYAAFPVPALSTRLQAATERQVEITLILESAIDEGGKVSVDPFKAIRNAVPNARLYHWPSSERESDPQGHVGSLHAKASVADGRFAFISSANLTGYAFDLNMELGVLVESERLATAIETHFARLVQLGTLREVDRG